MSRLLGWSWEGFGRDFGAILGVWAGSGSQVRLGRRFGGLLGDFKCLEASWGGFGAVLGHFGSVLGGLWTLLEPLGGILDASWSFLKQKRCTAWKFLFSNKTL